MTTNVLTDRLAKMEGAGLVEKAAYQERPVRYQYSLTEQGEALLPVVQEMCKWANRFFPETWVPPQSFMDATVK